MRKGLGIHKGKGYYNMLPMDSHIHSLSAKGVKTKYKIESYVWNFGTYPTLKEAKKVKEMLEEEGEKNLKIKKLDAKGVKTVCKKCGKTLKSPPHLPPCPYCGSGVVKSIYTPTKKEQKELDRVGTTDKKNRKEYIVYSMEYVENGDYVNYEEYTSENTLKEAKENLVRMEGVIYEYDKKLNRHRLVWSNWGSQEKENEKWEKGKPRV